MVYLDMVKKQKILILTEFIAIAVLALLLGSTSGGSPFFGDVNLIDEGQFGAWANHMLLGEKMFRDIYITYGPLYVYPLYLFFKIFKPSFFLIRLYLTVGSILGIWIINLLMIKFSFGRIIRSIILLFLVLLPIMQLRQGLGFLVIYFLLKSNETKNYKWNLLTGFSAGLTFLVSPDIGITSMILIIAYFIYKLIIFGLNKSFFDDIIFILSGLLSILVPFFLWSNYEGWFNSYITVTRDVLTSLSGVNSPIGQNFPNALILLPVGQGVIGWVKYIFSKEILLYWLIFIYFLTMFYLFVKFVLKIKEQENIILALVTLYGIILYTILLGRNGISHFFFVLSPALIICAFFTKKLTIYIKENKKDHKGKIISYLCIFLLLIFGIRLFSVYRPEIIKKIGWPRKLIINKNNFSQTSFLSVSLSQKKYMDKIENFVMLNTTSSDKIFFLTDEPGMYMLVNRVNPTRFDLPFIASSKDKRLEIVYSLQLNMPKYIIEDKNAWDVDGISNEIRLPEVMGFINFNYKKSQLTDKIIIYNLKNI